MDILRPGPDGPSAQVSVKAGALHYGGSGGAGLGSELVVGSLVCGGAGSGWGHLRREGRGGGDAGRFVVPRWKYVRMNAVPEEWDMDVSRDGFREPLLKAADAAALLSVRTSWVYEAVRAGRLPCVRVGRHVRFLRSDLAQWVRAQRSAGR